MTAMATASVISLASPEAPLLRDLGVTTLWLLPFYPSPGRDDGYDISDYGHINSAFGSMRDFRRFYARGETPRLARYY